MRPFAVIVIGAVLGATAAQGQVQLAITNVTVVDVERGSRVAAQTVLIEGARIRSVAPSRATTVPSGVRVIDGRGRFLVPGLWDMHVHLPTTSAERLLPMFVEHGVTGVRDMGSDPRLVMEWRRQISAGQLSGPTVVTAGPILDGPLRFAMPEPHRRWRIEVTDTVSAARVVDSIAALGVNFIKAHERLSPEVLAAIARRARQRGLHVSGHIPTAAGPDAALRAGLRSVEHLVNIPIPCSRAQSVALRARNPFERVFGVCDTAGLAPLYRRFVAAGTWHTPTLVVQRRLALGPDGVEGDPGTRFIPAEIVRTLTEVAPLDPPGLPRDSRRRVQRLYELRVGQVGAMHRAGVRLLAGTDGPIVSPGWALHEELGLLVRAGLSPLEALRAATLEPARYLAATDTLGTVAAGKRADLVLLDADPLRDIRNVRRIRAVIAAGRVVRMTP